MSDDSEFATQRYRNTNSTHRSLKVDDIRDEDVARIVEDYDPRLCVAQAYLNQIKERLIAARGWSFSKPETIFRHLDAINLPYKTEYEQARKNAWSRSSFIRCAAYDKLVWERFLTEGHQDIASANTYLSIIEDLGKNQGWTLNAQASDVAERQRLISRIVGA